MFVLALIAILILGVTIVGLLWLLSKFINNQRNQPKQEPEMPPCEAKPRISWLTWLEWGARAFVWVFVMGLAILTIIGVIPILPPNMGLQLVILLYVFLFAMLVTWIADLYRMFPRRRRQQSENRQQDQR
jgi:hypothetical protein